MKILALHDNEEVSILLADLAMITEVDVVSAPTLNRFKNFLEKTKFNAVFVLDKFFIPAMEVLLSKKEYPRAVVILIENEDELPKFLRLGVTEVNVETIPFNPLTLLVKTRNLVEVVKKVEFALKTEAPRFDFYRHGLFNVLNVAQRLETTAFLSVKNAEEDELLYSLRLANGEVVSSSAPLSKIVEVNTDDTVPKQIFFGPVQHEDREIFKGTFDFYAKLLLAQPEGETKPLAETAPPPAEKPRRVLTVRENPFREKRVYAFPWKGRIVYSQPAEGLKPKANSLVAVPSVGSNTLKEIKRLLLETPSVKFLTSPTIKGRLLAAGVPLHALEEETEGVETFDLPFLGNKFEAAYYLEGGYLITGNLFGSFVSKEAEFFEKIFAGHLKTYHLANVSSNEKLKTALDLIKPVLKKVSFVLPSYGYAIRAGNLPAALEQLKLVEIPSVYTPLTKEWKTLADAYGIKASGFIDFLSKLSRLDSSILFNIMDDIEVLGIVPLEL